MNQGKLYKIKGEGILLRPTQLPPKEDIESGNNHAKNPPKHLRAKWSPMMALDLGFYKMEPLIPNIEIVMFLGHYNDEWCYVLYDSKVYVMETNMIIREIR